MDNRITFEELVEQNKRRIHYQMHKMNIGDPFGEFFQEGLIALWKANESKKSDGTNVVYTVRKVGGGWEIVNKESKHGEKMSEEIIWYM